jgi:hypothetical protein
MFLDIWNLLFQLSGLPLLLSLILFVIKVPILLSTMENLRQRGETLQMPGYGGFPTLGGYNQAEQGQGQGQGQAGKSSNPQSIIFCLVSPPRQSESGPDVV